MRRKKAAKRPKVRKKCFFCQEQKEPDYKDVEALRSFLSERGRILGRNRTGTCARHQRQLTRSIKQARFLALLPFTARIQ